MGAENQIQANISP